jgi:DNA invertase Pin-like site-specific DNA recombinase
VEERAWLHVRKSRHLADPDDPKLLAAHKETLLRLALADGVPIPPEHIIAEVESGEFLSQRSAFRAWLEEIERLPEGSGGILYTIAVDRLSRGPLSERARIQEALQRAAILIRTPAGTTDLSDPDEELLAEVRGSLARQELRRFKARLALKRVDKLRRGEILTGGVPYGYRWSKDTGQPEPRPDQFPILQAWCREVLTTSAQRLSRRYGVSGSIVLRALHSPVLCGWSARRYVMGENSAGKRVARLLPRSQWVWAEQPGGWAPACTRAEWEAIQAVLAARDSRPEWTRATEDGWCRDVLQFQGAPAGAWVRLETGGGGPVYAGVDPVTRRRFAYVPREQVHRAATAALGPLIARPDFLAAVAAAVQEQQQQVAAAPTAPDLLARIAALRTQLERAVRDGLQAAGEETRLAHQRVQRELEQEIQSLRRQLGSANGARTADLAPLLREAAVLLGDFPAGWETLPGTFKRALVRALLVALPVVIEPAPAYHPRRREVLAPVWQPWVPQWLDTS